MPGEPKTFIFGGYDPYIEGLKPSFFMGLGSKGGLFLPLMLEKTHIDDMICMCFSAFLILRDGSDLQVWCRLVLF